MNPEILLQLRKNTKETCELKFEMQNMHDVIKSLKGLEINSVADKFKRHFNKLNHAA